MLQPDVYDVPFPPLYLQVLDALGAISFIGFDLPLMFKVECLISADYHSRLFSVSAASMLVLFVLVFALVRSSTKRAHFVRRNRSATLAAKAAAQRVVAQSSGRKFLSTCLVLSYLVYPSSSSVFFQTFNCRTIDGVEYHTKDLSIICTTGKHVKAERVATAMILLFSFGLPVVYMSLLFPQRRQIASASPARAHSMMGFFIKDYKPRFCYYWVCVCSALLCLLSC